MKLYEKLQQYAQSDYYPFHMPGHKRNIAMLPEWNPYEMDITEIDGFDNLHDAEEILAQVMKEIATFRGAEESFLLINGTTCGLLAGISSCVQRGDEVLVARNCHKAVYHGIFLNGLVPHYIYPPIHPQFGANGGISPEKIKNMLITYPNTKLVILTSPTYEGVVSDIEEIAKVVHSFGIPLLVDQAHGAHFGMHEAFPKSAITSGADLVVESVHKTLPAFTQTALLHVQGDLVDSGKVKKYLGIFETSSPSYPMMAGIEWCEEFCKKEQNGAFSKYVKNLVALREEIKKLGYIELFDIKSCYGEFNGFKKNKKNVEQFETKVNIEKEKNIEQIDVEVFLEELDEANQKIKCLGQHNIKMDVIELDAFDYDIGKLVIGIKNQLMTGQQLYDILLKRYHLQMEMASLNYVIAMTSVMDTEEGFSRLFKALQDINEEIEKGMEQAGVKEIAGVLLDKEKKGNSFCFLGSSELNIVLNDDKDVNNRLQYSFEGIKNEMAYPPYEAENLPHKKILFQESKGKVAGNYVYLYPPGIPLLVPGERIEETLIEQVEECQKEGLNVKGIVDGMVEIIA